MFGITENLVSTSRTGESLVKILRMIAKPGALFSGWTSALLCFSAASGFWLAGQSGKAIAWMILGLVEVTGVVA